jgi:hypothetical protein
MNAIKNANVKSVGTKNFNVVFIRFNILQSKVFLSRTGFFVISASAKSQMFFF